MKKLISHKFRKIILTCLLAILGIAIGLLGEAIGNDFSEWLKSVGINVTTVYVLIIAFTLIMVLILAFDIWSEKDSDKEPQTLDNIEPVIQLLFNSIEQRYENNLGKQINVSFESGIADENDCYIRTKDSDGIKIFPSKKIYGRLNLADDDWRKEFTVCYPIIKGIKTESVLHKINSVLNYEKNFDVSIQESIENDFWLAELDYSIRFIKRPFLVIELHMDGIGAYPWHVSKNLVINFETGNIVKITDVLDEELLPKLASVITEFIQLDFEIAILKDAYHNEIPLKTKRKSSHLKRNYGEQKFTLDNFQDFYFDEYSITFIYYFGFPHVIKAIEPEGHYCFSFLSL